MVLQRDRPIHLWGWADPGEQVTAALNGTKQTTRADDLGKWSVWLAPEQAGGPYQVTVAGTNTITLDDVMIGDVWFASGQSNMELPLIGFPGSAELQNSAEEIAHANQPQLRLLHIHEKASEYRVDDIDTTWTDCTPQTAATFSAAAYFFGRDIAEKEHVTVGLIDSTWGGTPAEAWISLEGLSADASLMPVFATWATMTDQQPDMPRIVAKEKREEAQAKATGTSAPWHPWHPNPASWAPAALYNGMVAPVVNFPIRGVIWYQGETNSALDRAAMYERVFPALIRDWREQWRQGDFPFLYVQISSFRSTPHEDWAVVREAQRRTLGVANTAMAVTIDIGNPDNVHPADKQDVGARLALAARALSYGEKVEYSGPAFRKATVDGTAMRVWFDHAVSGLTAKGGEPTGFEVAGADHKFVTATAHIDGDSIVASNAAVPEPEYVRYGWQNAPVVNLFNGAGLPASPFTSEKRIPQP
ncbi:sialate O-acetylesterase [Paracidobacterium acidisoli]|uniref:Sialate O-acetylesterase n=1 Tax=Paracidobacterium acidisoli TaxID=2303751 RepID=A0A372IQM4_9BACT|nr:sialate O-acetylesterase [Paracidobacterium acidisoli]MBT9330930.1 sialate O-acetylesterase [Paracidobacterium acidisoli]